MADPYKIDMRVDIGRYGYHEIFYTAQNNLPAAQGIASWLVYYRNLCLRAPAVLGKVTVTNMNALVAPAKKRSGVAISLNNLQYSPLYNNTDDSTPWDGVLANIIQGVYNLDAPPGLLVPGSHRSYILRGTGFDLWTGSVATGWAINKATQTYNEVNDLLAYITFPTDPNDQPLGLLGILGDDGTGVKNDMAVTRDVATGFIKLGANIIQPNDQPIIDWTVTSNRVAVVTGFTLANKKYNGRHKVINPVSTGNPIATSSFLIGSPYPLLVPPQPWTVKARVLALKVLPIGYATILGPAKRDTGVNKSATKGRYKRRPLLR